MNKKIYVGIIACGIAASFWACGNGDILKPTVDDGTMSEKEVQQVFPVLQNNPELCPACGVALVQSSSSSSRRAPIARSSSSRTTPKSSSSQLIINSATSSSAPPLIINSSSSQPPLPASSSSVIVNPGTGDPGTCGPEKPTVESGEKVNWVFTNGKDLPGNLLLNSDFTWTTSDGDPASATIGGYKGRTHSVTYATTGKHNASVSILVKTTGVSYNVSCTPVQVNGAPITGCKCSAEEKNPDVSVGAKWTVTGCTSAGANIVSYEWLGATAAEDGKSATQSFTKKKQMAAPVVNVGNDDNTVVAVQCDTIITVDATDPDYVIDGSKEGTYTVAAGVYKMIYACETSPYYQHSIIIEAPTGAVSAKVEGKSYSIAQNGRASVYKSTESNVPIDVEIVSGSAKISCE